MRGMSSEMPYFCIYSFPDDVTFASQHGNAYAMLFDESKIFGLDKNISNN